MIYDLYKYKRVILGIFMVEQLEKIIFEHDGKNYINVNRYNFTTGKEELVSVRVEKYIFDTRKEAEDIIEVRTKRDYPLSPRYYIEEHNGKYYVLANWMSDIYELTDEDKQMEKNLNDLMKKSKNK